jgi:ligand-binding sensor domain-containing protein
MSGNLLRTARLVCLFLVASTARLDAEHLPLRIYGEPDGLRGISVHRIVSDSKGFLWFCTNDGLSRYDGYGFTQFGAAGFTNPNVHSLLETRDGGYWVGTSDGLFHLGDRGARAAAFFRDAILRHAGEADQATRAYRKLAVKDQEAVLEFLRSL